MRKVKHFDLGNYLCSFVCKSLLDDNNVNFYLLDYSVSNIPVASFMFSMEAADYLTRRNSNVIDDTTTWNIESVNTPLHVLVSGVEVI